MGEPSNKFKLGDLASAIPVVGSALSGIINRAQSQEDIRRMNEYNDPANQLKRLREAGLPMAAMGNNIASTQSALPQTSGGALNNMGSYITNQYQIQQLKLLREQTKVTEAEAQKTQAETKYLLETAGTDSQATNLTQSLSTKQASERALLEGQRASNTIQNVAANNAVYKTILDNKLQTENIASVIEQRNLTGRHIKGADLDNRIKEVVANYQPQMSDAQLAALLKSNNLLDKSIEGKGIENAIQSIRYQIESATKNLVIHEHEMRAMLQELTWDRVKSEFETYERYQKFVRNVQDEIDKPMNQRTIGSTFRAYLDFLYTSMVGLSGSAGDNEFRPDRLHNLFQQYYTK